MKNVYIAADNIISSLGFTTCENCSNIEKGISGISKIEDALLAPNIFFASLADTGKLISNFKSIGNTDDFSRFEQMCVLSVKDALSQTDIDLKSPKTLFILSTTKGNIDILEKGVEKSNPPKALYLWDTADKIGKYFNNPNPPVVVSNACISGVMALIAGSRMIRSGQYENVVVTGADIISKFVVSGFQSFQSLSNGPCRPYDKSRDGLNLGEGCGTIILTGNRECAKQSNIIVGGGFTSNDANHISGPARTGEGLFLSIQKTMDDPLSAAAGEIDYISAHGTATPYNDEMEAIALSRAGLLDVPVNSYKGYWGHTLGAAGIIESVAAIYSLENDLLFQTAGFQELGVSEKINVIAENDKKPLKSCLKTASGFGGCNASIIFYKK
ncbi:MAG: beta-ketoacyl synthase N-terminal-like domain-containing protein [Bacteroidota bacterium]